MAALSGAIVDWLQPPGRILTRCSLEYLAKRNLGVPVKSVTDILEEMYPDPLIRTPIQLPGIATCHAYSFGDPNPQQLVECEKTVAARYRLLQPEKLRDTSERYVRALFRHVRDRGAAQYLSITNASRLGRIKINGTKLFADLVVGYETIDQEPIELLVEVKAHREEIDVTSKIITKLLDDAIAASEAGGYQPVFVPAYISSRARSFCGAVGIAVYALDRQFLPLADRQKACELWPTGWDDKFQFIRSNRVFSDPARIDPRSLHDLAAFRERGWIETTRLNWNENKNMLHDIAGALKQRDWTLIKKLLPSYSTDLK